jgi:hypothetical protein
MVVGVLLPVTSCIKDISDIFIAQLPRTLQNSQTGWHTHGKNTASLVNMLSTQGEAGHEDEYSIQTEIPEQQVTKHKSSNAIDQSIVAIRYIKKHTQPAYYFGSHDSLDTFPTISPLQGLLLLLAPIRPGY